MLLNLSNHPSSNWGERQMQAAKSYGVVKDLAFPRVDPKAESDEIQALADDYARDIKHLIENSSEVKNAVHIMGELSFCHTLVNLLQAANITCLVSTTQRDSVEENGTRISKFRFVKFRAYVYI